MIEINRILLKSILFITIIMGLLFAAKYGSARTDNQVTIKITDPKDGEEVPMEKVVRGDSI